MDFITTADNKRVQLECIACAISKREIEVLGGVIAASDHFEVTNDLEIPIPGFFIIHSKRHVRSIMEFTPAERSDFIEFLFHVREAMQEVLHIENVTLVQEEKSANSHFHMWLFPWHPWMQDIGSKLSSIKSIMEYAREHHKTDIVLKQITEESETLRSFLK